MTIRAWPRQRSEIVAELRILSLREDTCTNPRTGAEHVLTVVECPDWVNVVALTEAGRTVLIRQYRFGSRTVTLEIPGGVVDLGEPLPLAAARELREETGYAASRWTDLGAIAPNPAIQNNLCHTFLAEGCRQVGAPELTPSEDIEVEERDAAEVPALIAGGQIAHALVAVAFQKLDLHRRGLLPGRIVTP